MPLRIVYVSSLQPNVTEEELNGLVEAAAAFNKAHGITGILAIQDRQVCQILEGPDEELEALFRSIRHDARHSGIVELVRIPIEKSSFDAWGMARRPMFDMVTMAFTI